MSSVPPGLLALRSFLKTLKTYHDAVYQSASILDDIHNNKHDRSTAWGRRSIRELIRSVQHHTRVGHVIYNSNPTTSVDRTPWVKYKPTGEIYIRSKDSEMTVIRAWIYGYLKLTLEQEDVLSEFGDDASDGYEYPLSDFADEASDVPEDFHSAPIECQPSSVGWSFDMWSAADDLALLQRCWRDTVEELLPNAACPNSTSRYHKAQVCLDRLYMMRAKLTIL